MSNRQKVREYFEEMKIGTAAQAAKALGIPAQTASAHVRDLREQGWLVKRPGCFGMYDYHQLQDHEYGHAVKMQEKMWRAMRHGKTFTVWDIALYAGASIEYVRDYVKFLLGKGLIRVAGKKGQRPVYAIKEEAAATTPVMRSASSKKEMARQKIIDLGWELMRALRDGDIEKTGEINKRIETEMDRSGGENNAVKNKKGNYIVNSPGWM